MDKSTLGDRIKEYEAVPDASLMRKTPVILRVDGKAFHTYTKGLKRPVDQGLQDCMLWTARRLCEEIDGARLAYVQSDEISLLVADWSTLATEPWFGYRVQKMASVAASIATAEFNHYRSYVSFEKDGKLVSGRSFGMALFDCRVFNVPRHEVNNYFIWRQQDATRNSISSLARAHFSHKQLQNKNSGEMQDMLMLEKGINWSKEPTGYKRGFCVLRGPSGWDTDAEIPVFTQDREYVQRLVDEGEL